MIIHVRGTSGAGKSWVVNQAIKGLTFERHVPPGKKRPLWIFNRKHGLAILGHYETACGGCDGSGIRGMAQVNDVISQISIAHGDVQKFIFEGAILSEDTKWSKLMDNYRTIFLNTPIDKCIENVRQRRIEGGRDPEFKTVNTSNRHKVILRAKEKLLEAGVKCVSASSELAVKILLNWIKE